VDFSFLFSLCMDAMPAVSRRVGLVLKTNDTTYIPTFCKPTLHDSYLGTYRHSSAGYRTGGLPLSCRKLPRCFSSIQRVVSEGPGQCSSCDWYSPVFCGHPWYIPDLLLSTQIRLKITPPRKWPIPQKRCSALWATRASGSELYVTIWNSVARTRLKKLMMINLRMYNSSSIFRRVTTWDSQVVPRPTQRPCSWSWVVNR
jgi:hypothetical protein